MNASVELFSGCGGLAMGLSRAGFHSLRMVEWDRHSVANITHNRKRDINHVREWPIHQEDVRSVDWTAFRGVDLVAGGPPCQPFSVGGRHRGNEDGRDMWPEAIRAVREIEPNGFLFENVRGLTRAAFSGYLQWILTALAQPDVVRNEAETCESHLARLKKAGRASYNVKMMQVNAADYGAAQKRHRVIIMGIHTDLAAEPPALVPTHSRERLLWDQWVTLEYWKRHGMQAPKHGPNRVDVAAVKRLRDAMVPPSTLPWRTLRDAIKGLEEPGNGKFSNHILQLGARSYPGHTGSPLDMPSKALKAGVHGVPGGENTIALPDGSVRYLTVREAARLQGLPDDYEFIGSWSENMRQLGNAVPAELAQVAAMMLGSVIGKRSRTKIEHERAA
jgi:DNA (cytosine-5)-methyltransferase 1